MHTIGMYKSCFSAYCTSIKWVKYPTNLRCIFWTNVSCLWRAERSCVKSTCELVSDKVLPSWLWSCISESFNNTITTYVHMPRTFDEVLCTNRKKRRRMSGTKNVIKSISLKRSMPTMYGKVKQADWSTDCWQINVGKFQLPQNGNWNRYLIAITIVLYHIIDDQKCLPGPGRESSPQHNSMMGYTDDSKLAPVIAHTSIIP